MSESVYTTMYESYTTCLPYYPGLRQGDINIPRFIGPDITWSIIVGEVKGHTSSGASNLWPGKENTFFVRFSSFDLTEDLATTLCTIVLLLAELPPCLQKRFKFHFLCLE